MLPPLPPDEHARLRVLRSLDLLDTPSEPVFDRITRLAAKTLDVPIALVSLIDENRQWFKSRVGLDATETPREHAFCAHAILQTPPMVVGDAEKDERFCDNPLVTGGPNIRFYAGVPIRTKGGLAIGTLCAIDVKPRTLTADELDFLCALADLVSKEVHLRETLMLANSKLLQADVSLEASEARFRSIFEVASVGIALVSPDGGWIDVNEALCEIVGYSAAELKQRTFQQITHPEDLAKDLALLDQLIKDQIPSYQIEKRYLRKDGVPVWINLNVAKKTDAQGTIEYFVAIIRNIQQRKEAEASLAALRQDLERRVEERTAELEQAHDAMQANEERIRAIVETALDAFVGMDAQGRITGWNSQAEAIFGWRKDEVMGKLVADIIMPQRHRQAHAAGIERIQAGGDSAVLGKRLQLQAIRRSGEEFPVEMAISRIRTGSGNFYSAFINDITERKAIEQALAESRERLATITDNMPALISYVGKDERYQFTNRTYETWFGHPRHAIYGRTVRELLGEEQYAVVAPHIAKVLSGERSVFEYQLRIGDTVRHAEATYIPHWSAHGEVLGYYVMVLDITERKNNELRIEQLASHDALTGLPNRRACLAKLQEAIDRTARSRKGLAVLFLDLDKFKQINDTHGHEIGDQVLTAFAELLRKTVRKTDVVARLAGDEFVVIAEGLSNAAEDALLIGQKIVAALDAPLLSGEPRILASTSIGIALHAGGEAGSPATLLKRADEGMYAAKREGKNICHLAA